MEGRRLYITSGEKINNAGGKHGKGKVCVCVCMGHEGNGEDWRRQKLEDVWIWSAGQSNMESCSCVSWVRRTSVVILLYKDRLRK